MLEITTSKNIYKAKSVLICSGSRHRRLNVPGETDFLGRGVCYCATCDGPLYQGRKVLMVGGGNAAIQEALYLQSIGCEVTIVHRRDQLRAEEYLQQKLKEKKIPIIWDSVVEEIMGDLVLNQVVLYNSKKDEKAVVETSGIFIAIGEEPSNKPALSIGVETDKEGYVITDKWQRTNLPRVYAAGDITGGIKQWIVACSEGAVAALSAHADVME
jgi:thioredoxin reductase (NADPH)